VNKIVLNKILPNIFADNPPSSEIWQNEIEFSKGKFYLVEAESGKGKSSLFAYIYGYRYDFSGQIFFDENNINIYNSSDWDMLRQDSLSLLFQDLKLFPELTALENILLKNRLTDFKTEKEIVNMFQILEIEDKTHKKCAKLSWGQQQRVAIVRSLCQPFDFLLLDEPISHIDDRISEIAADLIVQEAQKQKAGVIVSSIGKRLPLDYQSTIKL